MMLTYTHVVQTRTDNSVVYSSIAALSAKKIEL